MIIKYLENLQWATEKSINRKTDPVLSADLESRILHAKAEKEKQVRDRMAAIIRHLKEQHEAEVRKVDDEISARKVQLHKISEIVRIHEQKMTGFHRSLEEHMRRFGGLRENLRAGLDSSAAELIKAGELVTALESIEAQKHKTVSEAAARFGIDILPLDPSSDVKHLKTDIERWLDEVRRMQTILVSVEQAPASLPPNEETGAERQPPIVKGRILIIDRDTADVEIIGYFLKENDFDIQIASDPYSGLELVGTYHPELILLDSDMMTMNGSDFFSNKESREKLSGIPVILIGPLSKKEQMEKALQAGASGYITKPFSVRDLQQKVEGILGQYSDGSSDSSAFPSS
ncbi:MAG: response regulator [Acidobacteria bacterium]|nr:response regulator [Acidobacteriota bacterium]